MTRPDDLVGYTYRADNYCGADIAEALANHGFAVTPGEMGNPDAVEVMLNELATGVGKYAPLPAPFPIDRDDEASFDSDEFPKVLLRDQAEDAVCANCGQMLANLPKLPWRQAADERTEAN